MSTIKTTNITHGSNSGTANLVLSSAGNVEARKINGCQRIILEQFFTPCDGSTIATANGNITVGNVTAQQAQDTTFTDVTGSSISYTPPTGTTQVIYDFNMQMYAKDTAGFCHIALWLDSDEVTDARTNWRGYQPPGSDRLHFKWGFNIGGTADNAAGRVASWSSAKTIKLKIREYSSSYETNIHAREYWDGGDDSNAVAMPTVGITAIG